MISSFIMEDGPNIQKIVVDLKNMPISAFQIDTFKKRIPEDVDLDSNEKLRRLLDSYELIYKEFYTQENSEEIRNRFIEIKNEMLEILSEI